LTMVSRSNGYENIAEAFIRARRSFIGPTVLRRWAIRLQAGASILDLGCGSGVPISETLLQQGFTVYGVDASATLIAKFRERYPSVPLECSPVEESLLFGRTFDGVVAWGLMFLLPVETQRSLIGKVAHVLNPQGHFLFTAPKETGTWPDGMTGLPSCSLGHEEYARELATHGLHLVGNDVDEGANYYYFAAKL
jgi:2-polyprenyl-3-methyl-5-hydroxy-6-metoxy-1,4-benzoquinol methylase